MEAMEALLQQLCPGTDFSEELGPPIIRDSWKNDGRSKPEKSPSSSSQRSSLDPNLRPKTDDFETPLSLLPTPRLTSVTAPRKEHRHRRWEKRESSRDVWSSDEELPTSTDSEPVAASATNLLTLRGTEGVLLADDAGSARFHGRGSVPGLADATRKLKGMLLEDSNPQHVHPDIGYHHPLRRPYFWRTPQWELTWEGYTSESQSFLSYVMTQFPPPEIAASMIKRYFDLVNSYYPILHRPTFERQYFSERLHERDVWFAAVCLAIFAVTSIWSNDPRMASQSARMSSGEVDLRKAGWGYFSLVIDCHRVRRSLIIPVTLFELQTFPLLALFLRGTSAYPIAWILIGIGLRKAQDIGAHRKKMYRDTPAIDGELWRRAFWHLVLFDALGATVLGRSSCVSQEECDVEMPSEVDDEYWEPVDGSRPFHQPLGVPSRTSIFIQFIKVVPLLVFAQKTVYAMDKSASFVPKTRSDREKVLKDLESALEDWRRGIPAHLRLSESWRDPSLVSEANMINFIFHFVQIVIYRPFLDLQAVNGVTTCDHSQDVSPAIAAKAMGASTTAAREIVRLVEIELASPHVSMTGMLYSSYYAGGQLLLGIWDLKAQEKALKEKKGANQDHSKSGPNRSADEAKLAIARQINELDADLRKLVTIYEGLSSRWDFTEPIAAWLREFLPKDGHTKIPEPDALLPPIYQPFTDYSGQPSQIPSTGSLGFPDLSQSQSTLLYSFSDIFEGSSAVDSSSLPSSQTEVPYLPGHGDRRMSVLDPLNAAQSLYDNAPTQPYETWAPRRSSVVAPPGYRYTDLYPSTGLQRSISVSDVSDLSNAGRSVDPGSSQLGSTYGKGPYQSMSFSPGQQRTMSGVEQYPQYHLESRPLTDDYETRMRAALAQSQPRSCQQPFKPPNESVMFANPGYQSFPYGSNNIQDTSPRWQLQ